MFNHWSIN